MRFLVYKGNMRSKITPLQLAVLDIIVRLGDDAYGAAITRVFERCGRTFEPSCVLKSLVKRGLVTSIQAKPDGRGGRPKRIYKPVTADSKTADGDSASVG